MATKVCPGCGLKLNSFVLVCPCCGQSVGKSAAAKNAPRCPKCNGEMSAGDKRCKSCGHIDTRTAKQKYIEQRSRERGYDISQKPDVIKKDVSYNSGTATVKNKTAVSKKSKGYAPQPPVHIDENIGKKKKKDKAKQGKYSFDEGGAGSRNNGSRRADDDYRNSYGGFAFAADREREDKAVAVRGLSQNVHVILAVVLVAVQVLTTVILGSITADMANFRLSAALNIPDSTLLQYLISGSDADAAQRLIIKSLPIVQKYPSIEDKINSIVRAKVKIFFNEYAIRHNGEAPYITSDPEKLHADNARYRMSLADSIARANKFYATVDRDLVVRQIIFGAAAFLNIIGGMVATVLFTQYRRKSGNDEREQLIAVLVISAICFVGNIVTALVLDYVQQPNLLVLLGLLELIWIFNFTAAVRYRRT